MSSQDGPVSPLLMSTFSHSSPLLPSIRATTLLCTILITIFTAARLVAKRWTSKYNKEDYLLLLAWVACIAYNILLLVAGLAGLGHHVQEVPLTHWPQLARLAWAIEITYSPTIWLAKAALLFQLIRIFTTPMKSGPIYWACHILIWGNLVFYTCILFLTIFECHPIDEVWDFSYQGHCINRNVFVVISGAINVLSDLLILLLPIWAIWHLQMALKRKAGLTAVFATGLLAFVSSICRLVYATYLLSRNDISYSVAQTALWGAAEINSIVLCTCLPMMPRFVKLISDRYSYIKSRTSRCISRGAPTAEAGSPGFRRPTRHGKFGRYGTRLPDSCEQSLDQKSSEGEQTGHDCDASTLDVELGTLGHSKVQVKEENTL